MTFSVFTRSGSAVGGQDFYGFTKSVSIPAGATTGFVSLTLLDDSLPESTEAMELRVFAVQGANVVDNVAVVSITDNDQPTMQDITIDDASVSESDGTVQVLVRLSQPSAQR